MVKKRKKARAPGDWAAQTFPGGIYANIANVMDFLDSHPNSAASAKVVQGTEQDGKIVSTIFYKE
jgi:hypothetical protein